MKPSVQHARNCAERSAFTLIELFVVVTVIGLLVAILIPAVQAVRAASRRSQCAFNLGQLALGVQSYNTAYGTLPMGSTMPATFSLHSALLPYIEQNTVYASLNFSLGGNSPQNRTAIEAKLRIFLCPADAPIGGSVGGTNYAGNAGGGVQKFGRNGAFVSFNQKPPSIQSFTDGTSTTALLSEWMMAEQVENSRDPLRVVFDTPDDLTKPDEFDAFIAECKGLDPATAALGLTFKGRNWLVGDLGFSLYNHTLPPNGHSCTNKTAYQQGAWTAGSAHSQGVNTAFVDGHVVFIKSSISPEIWFALASRSGGEVVSADRL